MTPPPSDTTDLDRFELDTRRAVRAGRRALYGLLGLLLLVLVSMVLLVWFLRQVEAEEADRQRSADAQWLDQSLRFHFRRLEADVAGLLPQVGVAAVPMDTLPHRAGALWRGGAVRAHGWWPAEQQAFVARWPHWVQAELGTPEQADALVVMLNTARGLRRPTYAGPWVRSTTPGGDTVLWLAYPWWEGEHFRGSYVLAVAVERALEQAIPAWFLADHRVQSVPEPQAADLAATHAWVSIPLSGAQWGLLVAPLGDQAAVAPRAFFGAALLCLLGMLVALLFLGRVLAQRWRLEARLGTQMALRQAMERSVTLGLLAWDLNGRPFYANQALCRMVGWSGAELLAPAPELPCWPAEQGPLWPRVVQLGQAPPERQSGDEGQLLHRAGHRLDVWLHAAPLALADGRVIGWMASVLDISERRRMERLAARQQERLEASARLVAVGEVASTLAHELNQPLGALSSFATGLLNRLRQQRITLAEVEPVVERMERMADKAGRVIQRVNAFARRQEMLRQPLALAPFVARVAAAVPLPDGVVLDAAELEHGPTPTVPADALLLEHALHNVVRNAAEWAAQANRTPAQVRVGLVCESERVGILVEDTGPGIPDDLIPTLFEAFATRKPGGMGMGLSIARSMVEAHHGRIEVGRSTALGGAQFTLWLPLGG